MKYCIHYTKGSKFRYLDKVDEIEITFRQEDTTLPQFLEKFADKTVILSLTNTANFTKNKSFTLIKALSDKYKNIKVKFSYQEKEILDMFTGGGVPFFFSEFVDSWDTLIGFLAFKPTDVYVINELGFELNKVANICHYQNTQVRVFPNIAQSQHEGIDAIKKFFIRPEDIETYSSCVDVCEFVAKEEQLSVYFDIYANSKRWFGNLREIIVGLDIDLDSRGVTPNFAESRMKCGKRCLKGRGCKICERAVQLANTLAEKELMLVTE